TGMAVCKLEQAACLGPLVQIAFEDLGHALCVLALPLRVQREGAPLRLKDIGGHLVARNVPHGVVSGDGHRHVARQPLELVRAGDEIRFAVELDERAKPCPVVDVAADDAFAYLSVGLLGGRRQALLAEPVCRLLEVSPTLLERSLAIHYAGAGLPPP